MRILLTGARGQLGTDIAARLPDRDEVVPVDLPEFDLTDRDTALGVVTQFQPDVILHCAAFTAVDLCEEHSETAWRANALATRFIADGARRVGAHVVYLSTDYVFDGTKAGPYLEWDRPNPQSVYGRSKLGGELEVDTAWSIVRTSWVCGEHGNNMVKTLLRLGEGSGPLSFVDDQIGHPTFTSDLAGTGLALAGAGAGQVPLHQPGGGQLVRVRPHRVRPGRLRRRADQPDPHRSTRPASTGDPPGQLGAGQLRLAPPRVR
ncbi:MAG: NAD(P)-dependent oxidoreductase [Microthrixaceae bacterium]